ncbi:IS66 family insertion sequence element accessory protein TnpB [Vibrio harveyi]
MKMFVDIAEIYLHKASVDFRKEINGLSLIVEQQMNLNPFSEALFIFCNRSRDKLKVLY